ACGPRHRAGRGGLRPRDDPPAGSERRAACDLRLATPGSRSRVRLDRRPSRAMHGQPPMKLPIYFKQLQLGPMQNYVYLLGDPNTHEAAVVDAAWDRSEERRVGKEW